MIIIQTNVHIGNAHPNYTVHSMVLDQHPDEFDPELIFHAANRIDDVERDVMDLDAHPWLIPIRRGLDACRAPSMSTGDRIHIFTHQQGRRLGYYECMSRGWDHAIDTRTVTVGDVLNHTHTHYLDCVDHQPTTQHTIQETAS